MKNLEHLFSTSEVLLYLSRKRAASATDTASKRYFDNFGPSDKAADTPDINSYFPARDCWFNAKPTKKDGRAKRINLSNRIKLTIQYNSPWRLILAIDRISNHTTRTVLHKTLHALFKVKVKFTNVFLTWAASNNTFLSFVLRMENSLFIRKISAIKKRSSISYWKIVEISLKTRGKVISSGTNGNIVFVPEFIPAVKDINTFRLLCKFTSEDSLILAQTSRYLRSISDDVFSSSSFAFRCPPKDKKMPTHHDAIASIHTFIQESHSFGSDVFVAECDIKKFFDSIPHETIYKCLQQLEDDLAQHGKKIDPKAIKIVSAFLASYRFPVARSNAHRILLQRGRTKKNEYECFPWIDNDPVYLKSPTQEIGIPQGSALSCFIANLVLHYADQVVENTLAGQGIYCRYCDDMIILTNSEELTNRAFHAYISKLNELKLPYHQPKKVAYTSPIDQSNFWNCKSKDTYKLAKLNIPWCGFVGYQLSFDGKVRPRLSSFKKEIAKQHEVANGIISRIRNGKKSKTSITSIVMSANRRIVSRAAGKGDGMLLSTDHSSNMSWVGGFDFYAHPNGIKKWGRELDRSKVRILKSLSGRLHSMKKKGTLSFPAVTTATPRPSGPYLGRKYSYARRCR